MTNDNSSDPDAASAYQSFIPPGQLIDAVGAAFVALEAIAAFSLLETEPSDAALANLYALGWSIDMVRDHVGDAYFAETLQRARLWQTN